MTKTISIAASEYANSRYALSERKDEPFYYSEAEKGGEYTAALGIMGDIDFVKTSEDLMRFTEEFEFRNGDADRLRFLQLSERELIITEKAYKFYKGENRSKETALAATEHLKTLFRRAFDALSDSISRDNASRESQDYRDLCMALDTEQQCALKIAYPDEN